MRRFISSCVNMNNKIPLGPRYSESACVVRIKTDPLLTFKNGKVNDSLLTKLSPFVKVKK